MRSAEILFFQRKDTVPFQRNELPEGLESFVWVPGTRPRPPRSHVDWHRLVWSGFHVLHVFRNRDLTCQMLVAGGGAIVHRAYLFPPYARFPFMADSDLQVGDVWTHPAWRGRGLATWSIRTLAGRHPAPRTVWYLTEAGNVPSIRSARAAGFELVAEGHRGRTPRSLVARYRILKWC